MPPSKPPKLRCVDQCELKTFTNYGMQPAMKFHILLSLFITTLTSADTIRLVSGQNLSGQIVAYQNLSFEVQDEAGKIRKLPASSVASVDFAKGSVDAALETRNAGKIQRKISSYEKGAFSLEDETGAIQKMSAMLVNNVSFGGGSSSAKPVENVGGTDLTKHIVAGKITIFDFYADWCGPCRTIGPVLEDIAKKDSDVVVRKINVDNNQTLARKYKVNGIPHIMVYNKTGKMIATIVGADKDGVQRAVADAKKGS